ncbi:MAG: hypothetical protein F4Z29_01515 [Gemmatimonadetes bacterium]|nr:hypothetical protein [Gemmatimonadota bacterium]
MTVILVSLAIMLAAACGEGGAAADPSVPATAEEPPKEQTLLRSYLWQVDRIDLRWRDAVADAYVGREYLANEFGSVPEGYTAAQVLEDTIGNLTDLMIATQTSLEEVRALTPPPEAVRFHRSWEALLSDLEMLWSTPLTHLEIGDNEAFRRWYLNAQEKPGELNASIAERQDQLNAERNALGDLLR